MLIGRPEIAALIPHAGRMCLLDRVLAWDGKHIICGASSHRAADNPLALHGRLDALCGIEYAAQAMAVHGGLLAEGPRPAAGYLASLRDVTLCVDRLDLLEDDLLTTAELLIRDGLRVIYRFDLTCAAKPVLCGRAAVVIDDRPPQ